MEILVKRGAGSYPISRPPSLQELMPTHYFLLFWIPGLLDKLGLTIFNFGKKCLKSPGVVAVLHTRMNRAIP